MKAYIKEHISEFRPKRLKEIKPLEFIMYKYFYRALAQYNWNRYRTSRALGINVRTVRLYIQRLRAIGVVVPESKAGKHWDGISAN